MPPNYVSHSSTSADRRDEVVRSVLDDMELSALRTVQLKDLTAEQRKHASLAVELLTSPALLVLDEPTAGLDPAAAATADGRRCADSPTTDVSSWLPPPRPPTSTDAITC